jgi:hypothetical protein
LIDHEIPKSPTARRPRLRLWHLAALVAVVAVGMAVAIQSPVLLAILLGVVASYRASSAWDRLVLEYNDTHSASRPRLQAVFERTAWFGIFLLGFFYIGILILMPLASFFNID